jgi:predicted DNA-binding protein
MAMTSRTQTMVQLNEELLERLDRRASASGVSRSQVIREAIEAYLADDQAATTDRLIVEGYTRMPQGGEYDADAWGELGAMATALTVDQMRRLNEEERAAGFEPW